MGVDKTKYKYVYGRGRTALNLSESEIRYAMENTKSNSEAARFLEVTALKGDAKATAKAIKQLAGTCKARHQSYRSN